VKQCGNLASHIRWEVWYIYILFGCLVGFCAILPFVRWSKWSYVASGRSKVRTLNFFMTIWLRRFDYLFWEDLTEKIWLFILRRFESLFEKIWIVNSEKIWEDLKSDLTRQDKFISEKFSRYFQRKREVFKIFSEKERSFQDIFRREIFQTRQVFKEIFKRCFWQVLNVIYLKSLHNWQPNMRRVYYLLF